MSRGYPPKGIIATVLCAAAVSCSPPDPGIAQGRPDDPVIVLSEGECKNSCPVYDITLHPDGAYLMNGEQFVKTAGVSEGTIGAEAWAAAEKVLKGADFWKLKTEQTADTLSNCQPEAPTVKITYRVKDGKEKTVTYNAGCGVKKMQTLVYDLRSALKFDDLVWTDKKFEYKQPRLK